MSPTGDQHMAWYRRMLEIRLFEEKVQELFMEGLIQGTTSLPGAGGRLRRRARGAAR